MSLICNISYTKQALNISWSDGSNSHLLAMWLRDHCQMPESRNPANGQRLMNITDFPLDVQIKSANLINDDQIEIVFEPRHISIFPSQWLFDNAYDLQPAFDNRSAKNKVIWDKSSINSDKLFHSYPAYLANPQAKSTALAAFRDYGFIVLTEVPTKSGTILDVIESFGYVRETNYGKTFDVKTEVNPNNLAFTNLGLGLHADNPYRDPVPTVQLLHCLENTVEGGESLLADGFKAAEILRQESPEAFELLANTWINFRFQDIQTDLHSRAPFIETNDRNEVIKVRFNNRSIAPIKIHPKKVKPFYKAYRHYAEILERDGLEFEFKTKPGDLMLFDNARIFHARKAFSDSGSRWLQGAYADLDSLYSSLSVLQRNQEAA